MTPATEGSGRQVEGVEDALHHHEVYGFALAAGPVVALTLGAVSRLVRRPQGLRKARGGEWKS